MRGLIALAALLLAGPASAQTGLWNQPDAFDRENEGIFIVDTPRDVLVFALYTHWGPRNVPDDLPVGPIVSPPPPPPEATPFCVPVGNQPTVSPAPPDTALFDLSCDAGLPFWVIGVADNLDREQGIASGVILFSPNFAIGEAEATVIGEFFYVEDTETDRVAVQVAWRRNPYFNSCAAIYEEYVVSRFVRAAGAD